MLAEFILIPARAALVLSYSIEMSTCCKATCYKESRNIFSLPLSKSVSAPCPLQTFMGYLMGGQQGYNILTLNCLGKGTESGLGFKEPHVGEQDSDHQFSDCGQSLLCGSEMCVVGMQ